MPKNLTKKWNKLWSKLPTLYRGTLILSIPIFSAIPAIASWMWSTQATAEAYWWIERTEEVIEETNSLMQVLVDAQTAIRGYTITQEQVFLEEYQETIVSVPIYHEQIAELIRNNSQQQQQLETIEAEIQKQLNLLAQILDQIETGEPTNQTQSNQLLSQAKQEIDAIRDLVNQFKTNEFRLLSLRLERLDQVRMITNFLFVLAIAISILGYWIALQLYYKSQANLEDRAKKLESLNQTLATTNQLLETRNQELDRFTYIVSHDLKAPLRGIDNLSEWLEEDLQDKLDEDTSKHIALLRQRVSRLTSFIDALLEYSRVGRSEKQKVKVDVKKLLEEIIDSLQPPPQFIIEIEPNMPILNTDALLLQQVFSNLISNAIKHYPGDEGKVKISVASRGEYYLFSVADNGMGIAPEHQKKVFEIFQTVATNRQQSTGIGLSIVKKIVETQGGKIWLESQPDQGTTFYFTWHRE